MSVELVPAHDRPEDIGPLFSEYTGVLIAGDSAIRLYRRHGFRRAERYNDSPMDDSIYMGID